MRVTTPLAIGLFAFACFGCGDNARTPAPLSVSVTGLAGDGLVLLNEGGDALTISANGESTFATPIMPGDSFAITVGTQPSTPTQTCLVANGSGIMSADQATDIVVTCATGLFTVGGTVSGLTGTGLVLQNNGTDDLAVAADGTFAFAGPLASGSAFLVTVRAQPSTPTQTCTVTGAAGTVGAGNVTTVVVDCGVDRFTVSGLVTGLAGTVVLQNNAGDNITVSATGGFAFPGTLASGATYAVTVLTQPATPSQTCTVASGTGVVTNADVTSVRVSCTTRTFSVGGTVTGLAGTGLVLQNRAGDNLLVPANGTFTFATPVASGASYEVTVLGQPAGPTQLCTVTGGTGIVGGAAVTSVAVTCTTTRFPIRVTVSGLAGTGLVLQNNGGDDLTANADGTFTFATAIASGATYTVSMATQPSSPSQTCTVAGGTGTVGAGAVTSVAINCSTTSFALGGTVSGLAGTLVLQNNGGTPLTLTANGSFAFAAPIASGSAYAVTVLSNPASPSQTCTVANGSGTVTSSPVASVIVTCALNSYTVGGTVSGLSGSGLVLRTAGVTDLSISANGSFTFSEPIPSGGSYFITVAAQPAGPSQTCSVANASGMIGGANVTDVAVTCSTTTFAVGGSISGLAGSGLILQNAGGDDLGISANGTFTFAIPVASGSSYAVTVLSQPTGPSQTCSVASGTGTVTSADVTTVLVTCTTNAFTVGGTVAGLTGGGLVLQSSGTDDLVILADGSFTFTSAIASGTPFAVSVLTQPAGPTQTCTVTGGTGTIGSANVTSVMIDCATDRFTVSGTITGLATSAVLQNNAGDDLTVSANGTFAFATTVASGTPYAVSVLTPPTAPTQTCVVTAGAGTVTTADVTDVLLTCTTDRFTIGGQVTGATPGGSLTLRNNGADDLMLAADGSFTFPVTVLSGAPFAVTIDTSASAISQTCTVSAGSGTVGAANVTTVAVSCTIDTFTIGGTVNGLASTDLVLENNGGDNLMIAADGSFTFTTAVASGGAYAVTVGNQPTSPAQTCTVTNSSGSVGSANITNVAITCTTNTYSVGGTVTGLTGAGLTLRNNGADSLMIATDGSFTFMTEIESGGTYAVTVLTQPTSPSQTCTVTNSSGSVGSANITNVAITCMTNTFTVSGTLNGLSGTALTLRNNGVDDLLLGADGSFTFTTPVASGAAYAVTVASQPSGENCMVGNAIGTIGTSSVTNILVTCSENTVMSSRGSHTCEIRANGTLWCWGGNWSGQLGLGDTTRRTVPTQVGGATWATIASSYNHTCGTQTDGTLWCWGHNGSGQLGAGDTADRPALTQVGTATWASVSTGSSATCGTQSDGSLWCWGANWSGQLGLADTTNRTAPARVGTETDWKIISSGDQHACATRSDRTLWCWGANWSGQLGMGDTTQRATPTRVGAAADWIELGSASNHVCATRLGGTLWCWGANWEGQLGLGDTTERRAPEQVGTATWASVDAASAVTCGLRTDNTLWCWGSNDQGGLGVGDLLARSTPTQVGAASWAEIAVGNQHTCARDLSGALACWGSNAEGRLGMGTAASKYVPTQVGTELVWITGDTSWGHTCAVHGDGTLWCWGSNWSGQLGIGTTVHHKRPVQVGTASTWSSVQTGDAHTCAVEISGELWCWGANWMGQLGQGAGPDRVEPARVGTATWTSVHGGGDFTCGTQTDDTLWCWGGNYNGQLGQGDMTERTTPTQVGTATWSEVTTSSSHVCARQPDGTLWCWGANWGGQLGLGDANDRMSPTQVGTATTWTAVSSGQQQTCALQSGTLWCWGSNSNGQLGLGHTSSVYTPMQVGAETTWSTIGAGNSSNCATRDDGSLWCWGANYQGQLGLGDTTDRHAPTQVGALSTWSAVFDGSSHNCATRTDDSLWCWGAGDYGQLGDGDAWYVTPMPL